MAPPVRQTVPLRLYAGLTALALPLALARVSRKLLAEGIDPARIPERQGIATLPRPAGPLVWFHAASVGESLSIQPLVQRLVPDVAVLVTTGTAAAAKVMATRLPPGAIHQFAPLDGRRRVDRFLAHWHPDLAVFVESEIWPIMLATCQRDAIPLVLMNARLSAGSLRNWQRLPATARQLFSAFRRIYVQSAETLPALAALGADPARLSVGGNMKAAAGAPPFDPAALADLRARLGQRAVWAAVSTHPGEEAAILAAHRTVQEALPGTLLILVPRHPPRATAIAGLIAGAGFTQTRRSLSEPMAADVFLADTLGETGLWFRLSPVVFLGGSFVAVGGHNPWEPVAAGAAVLTGPLRANVADDMDMLEKAGAVRTVADGPALAVAVVSLLTDTAARSAMQAAALTAAAGQTGRVDSIAAELMGLMGQ